MLLPSFTVAVFFSLIHLFIHKIKVLNIIPRSRFLSFGGGLSAAYVFMHLLPELYQRIEEVESVFENLPVDNKEGAFFVVLLGMTAFYGLEKFSMAKHVIFASGEVEDEGWSAGVYWSHLLLLAVFNVIIGMLLNEREAQQWSSLLATAFAIGAHFFVTDHALLSDHRKDYIKSGRWILSFSVVAGWFLGANFSISSTVVSLLFAFLIGGIIMNVIKEELPQEKKSKFGAFLSGVLFYSFILFST